MNITEERFMEEIEMYLREWKEIKKVVERAKENEDKELIEFIKEIGGKDIDKEE